MNKIIIFVLSVLGFTSCNNDYESEYKPYTPTTELGKALVEKTDLVSYMISDVSYSIASGLETTEINYLDEDGHAMRMFMSKIDLKNDNITLETEIAYGNTTDNKNFKLFQQPTKQALYKDREGHYVAAGTNADFADITNQLPNPQGIVYKDGVAIKTTWRDRKSCNFGAILKDGTAVIGTPDLYDQIEPKIKEAWGGRAWLVSEGEITVEQDTQTDVYNPRTWMGVSEDGLTVYIIVVDGRRFTWSQGMTYWKQATVMHALGAWNSINLDGGGSSVYFLREPNPTNNDNKFHILNYPTDDKGRERDVSNSILVISKEKITKRRQ